MNATALPTTEFGTIPSSRKKIFYRVERWSNGSFVADFATKPEADAFAISDARENGCRYDHKVSTIELFR